MHCDYNAVLFVLNQSSVHEATSKNINGHITRFGLIITYGSHPLKMDVHPWAAVAVFTKTQNVSILAYTHKKKKKETTKNRIEL